MLMFVRLPNGVWVNPAKVATVHAATTDNYVLLCGENGDALATMLVKIDDKNQRQRIMNEAVENVVKLLVNPPPNMVLSARPSLPFTPPEKK